MSPSQITAEAPEAPVVEHPQPEGHRLPWPDALALTALIGFWAMVCAGWFDPMLPWVK